jgi:hypothetical protein
VRLPAIPFVLLLVSSRTSAGSMVPIEHVTVDVRFSNADWRLEIESRGQLDRFLGDSKLSVSTIDDAALKRIRGLALCVATVREPVVPRPPQLYAPEAMPPVVVLAVRAKTSRGRVVERKIALSPRSLEKHDMHVDVGPSLLLLFEMRAFMGSSSAYDYRPWLRDLLPRTTHPRCPWLNEPMRE